MNEALATRTSLRNTEPAAGELVAHDSIFDRDSDDDIAGNHPEWCVDLGEELRAMNKFELWLALGTGDVARDARVWRVGRECWQPACEIPDLACALKLHAQVLMATVRAAESDQDSERVTLVPGEMPALVNEKLRLSLDDAEVDRLDTESAKPRSLEDEVIEEVDPSELIELRDPTPTAQIEVIETVRVSQNDVVTQAEVTPPVSTVGLGPSSRCGVMELSERKVAAAVHCNQESDEAVMHLSRSPHPEEVEAKSVTPGPATVDAPEAVINQAVIRKNRGLPRKKESSAWSGIAAIAALAATSLLTLPGALSSGNSPSAAAHLPTSIAKAGWTAVAGLGGTAGVPSNRASNDARSGSVADTKQPELLPAAAEPAPASATVADGPVAREGSETSPKPRKSPATRPSKHRVRPTSVSPSHLGQGRSRQHNR